MTDLPAPTLRKTALFDLHERQGGRIVPFAGWAMPVQYRGIVDEHNAVRQRAGVFDVSHMGRLFVVGADAERLLRSAVTYNVAKIREGRGHYTLLCNDAGGIIDDPYIYRLDSQRFLVVGNASNADRDTERVRSFVAAGMDAELLDRQEQTVMLAVQGPAASGHMARVIGPEVAALEKRACTELPFLQYKLFVSRTGYTGEDGFEIVTSIEAGRAIWRQLLAEGVEPCGLGARDTLRLEAALPLWGHDIDETTDPYEAGLGWVVSLDDGADFAGRAALELIKAAGPSRKLAHVQALDRGVIRDGCPVLRGGAAIGAVTSGGFSPTLGTSIAMAYLPRDAAAIGTELSVDVRGRAMRVVVVGRPFVPPANGKQQTAKGAAGTENRRATTDNRQQAPTADNRQQTTDGGAGA
jgi:aminomethyltransferase